MRRKILWSFIIGLATIALFAIKSKVSAMPSLENDNIVIYAINEATLEQFPELEIPNEYPQQYQLKFNGTSTPIEDIIIDSRYYSINIDVSKSGLITPKKYYNSKGQVYYEFDDIEMYAIVDGKKITFNVTVKNYGYDYVNNKLKEYADSLKGLSNYQKVQKFAEYVSNNFDYGTNPNHVGMYLYGSGSCDASAMMINKLCEYAGIKAETRNGNHDSGASGEHVNNVVLIDNEIYIVDAGFASEKPRPYAMYKHEIPYTYKINNDNTVMLYQYDGFEEEKLVLPSEINGRKVTGIHNAFYIKSTKMAKEIVLPNTITTIEDDAFLNAMNLKKINIPASVTDIQGIIFDHCKEDLEVVIDKNANYIIENDVLYNKEKTKLIQVLPSFKNTSLVLPDKIKEIPLNTFRSNQYLKEIKLPSNLEVIDQYSFETIVQLKKIVIPKAVKQIGYSAFSACGNLETIEFEDGCKAEIMENAFSPNYNIKAIRLPSSITKIADNAFKTLGKNAVIYGEKGSEAEKYANKHNITFKDISEYGVKLGDVDGNGKVDAQDAVMILKYVAHNIKLTNEQLLTADTNKDGNVDAQDAVQILKYVAHNITEF